MDLNIVYNNTTYLSGIQINYKLGGYPTSPTDGSSMTINDAVTTAHITGLVNENTYYFRVFLFRIINNVKYFQTDITNARITGVPKYIGVTGITPLVQAADHIVITTSGVFNLVSPIGTNFRLILGSGAQDGEYLTSYGGDTPRQINGGHGGNVMEFNFTSTAVNTQCKLTLGDRVSYGYTRYSSQLIINNKTFAPTSLNIINTKWGPIGGDGGYGKMYVHNIASNNPTAGTGAGGGGGGSFYNGAIGGNSGGYGNYGGDGGRYHAGSKSPGYNGSSGLGGSIDTSDLYGYFATGYVTGGGGGGFAAGGGGGSYYDNGPSAVAGGYGGTGILVIEW